MVLLPPVVRFALPRATILAAAVFAVSCGDSASVNVAGPGIERCQVSVTAGDATAPAGGGTGSLSVATERECSWSARSDAPWISLNRVEGQGPGTLTYSVQPNPNGATRRGVVTVHDQRVEVSQEPAPCRFEVSPSSADAGASGGAVELTLAAPGACAWSAQVSHGWLAARPGAGTGGATLRVDIAPNDGGERRANVTVAGVTVEVRQAGPATPAPAPTPSPSPSPPVPTPPPGDECAFDIAPVQRTVAAGGDTFTASVNAAAACPWTASSQTTWVAVQSGAQGRGSGTVQLRVQPNSGPARTGTVTIARQTLTIEQSAASAGPTCSYVLAPSSRSVGAGAEEIPIEVRTTAGCTWAASSRDPWLTMLAGQTGSGPGSVRVAVSSNTGPAPRTGSLSVAGISFSVEQAAAVRCTYAIRPTYYNAGRGPDDVRIEVQAAGECAWSAASTASWASIAEGRSGTGTGSVRVLVEPNDGAPRSTTLVIAGEPFTLTQEGSCEATIRPSFYNAGPGPDDIRIQVRAENGCAWRSSSPIAWARIIEGSEGTGNAQVRVEVDPNSGAARSAVLSIAGQRFSLTQEARRQ